MIELIKRNKLFYLLTGLFWLACIVVLLTADKGTPLLFINRYHDTLLDYFFVAMTYFGDGLFSAVFLIGILLLVNIRKAIVVTITFLSLVLVIQALKFTFLEPRPFIYFQETQGVYYIPWLEIHKFNSFPSGHTAQAFCFALCVCFYAEKKYTVFLFLLAAFTGLSRMYLLQHFPVDVFVGSLVAVAWTTLIFPLLENRESFLRRAAFNQSLVSLLKK
ncbi:MAG: rane-associated phospholipid phosphatase [Chitinophagaceae bacterium]|nr:rane-associated phospholipid phosphatase [Chitinophagaceae bacterium]